MTGDEFFGEAGKRLALRQIEPAFELFGQAAEAGYDADQCAAGRWSCFMLAGEFELAWQESDGIARRGSPDPHRFWDGSPFAGKRVMLRCLHGLGDTLQFIRYAPLVRREAASLTIEAQPKLKPLLSGAGLADHVITWGETEPRWDQQVEVMELPRIFRTTIQTIPRDVPYIDIAESGGRQTGRPAGPFRVGLAWAASEYDPARSIPVQQLVSLLTLPGVCFVEPWREHVEVLPEERLTLLETAKLMKGLDLVITVDTMSAHLAGAMGRPVWTLLPHPSDWRWMLHRSDSPWYPSMRLFRQAEGQDWRPVLDRVKAELSALVSASYSETLRAGPNCPAHLARVR